jgi:hypothetical protein
MTIGSSKADPQEVAVGGNLRPGTVFRCAEKPTHLATALTAESRLIYDVWYCNYPEIGRTTRLMYDQYSQSFDQYSQSLHEP